MKTVNDVLDWPALIAAQPAASLIPETLRVSARWVEADAHEMLFLIGDPVRHVYLVIRGEARLVRLGRNGCEVILQRSRGGFIAEASLDSRTYHCDAIASEPTTLLLFPIAAFHAALEDVIVFRKTWQLQLAREIQKLRAQCERLCLHSATERIIHFIESEGSDGVLTLSQSRKSWAKDLGLTHEALYRALKRMQSDGRLEVEGNHLAIKP
ncbi:Crp/Fnr family transcriptional regulator [Pseudomonas sp. MWU13-2100]|uniref:Crp/Fnr family transcriptional regulator n=1 Tax=Pseudomonas sp. MWU13-2100 TaxID=2935075 RepID=UPI00200C7FBC|nr:Crp/Fnr family transcriptional regulator [Pseudomonas sp. MWU13-2100]